MKYHICSEKIADYAGIREVNILAFNNKENEAKLIEAIRESEFFIPELSLVACKDGYEIIGHILFSRIAIETEKGEVPTLAHKYIVVLGHPNFYPRVGFIPALLPRHTIIAFQTVKHMFWC